MRLPWPLLLAAGEDDLLKSLLFGKRRDLEEGRAYLLKERKPDRALAYFRRIMERGFRPMYVTRQHPNHIERTHGGKEIRVVWLSTTLGKDYVDPHNLNSLTNLVANFVGDGGHAVILLDGIEYLMMNNDFARILHFIEYLSEQIAIRRAILLLSLDDRAFEPKELALLERNMVVVE
jgi:pentatricopeptide repeat protein